ncbi:inorganic triphosphatase [Peptococcaceae bacterium CEB3]|nr:inorganic triphosphatase [Peptococcaceae bacterium CEB3]
MSTEIERKFLVFKEKLPELKGGQHFVQGYLQREPQIRFRFSGERVVLAVKTLKPDGSRFEFEAEKSLASTEERRTLCELAIVPPIEKTRYSFPYGSLIWEVDVYAGENAGLVTVDVEMPRLDYPLKFPEWVNAEAEITRDPRYFNYNLAQRPFKCWREG